MIRYKSTYTIIYLSLVWTLTASFSIYCSIILFGTEEKRIIELSLFTTFHIIFYVSLVIVWFLQVAEYEHKITQNMDRLSHVAELINGCVD